MNIERILELARRGRLYPAAILHGGRPADRREAAVALARALLCAAGDAARRPCGACAHCARVAWPEDEDAKFHPDFHVLQRDLRTVTSVDATKSFLHDAWTSPYEARGQVFVIAEAETLGGGAGDALLKILEEPPSRSPRHFLLLAGSRLDLPPTLRSRALSVYLGAPERLDPELVEELASALGEALDGYFETASPVLLLSAAEALGAATGWEAPRARRPWAAAAAAILAYARRTQTPALQRRALYECAVETLDAWQWRVRGIPYGRLLEGLLSRHLSGIPGI